MKMWFAELARLHEAAKRDDLSAEETTNYLFALDELSRFLLAAQRMQVRSTHMPRQMIRVSRLLAVEVSASVGTHQARTQQLSMGGCSVQMGTPLAVGDMATLRLSLEHGPTIIAAQVVQCTAIDDAFLVSFSFSEVDASTQLRLQYAVFDSAIEFMSNFIKGGNSPLS